MSGTHLVPTGADPHPADCVCDECAEAQALRPGYYDWSNGEDQPLIDYLERER